MRRTVLAAAFMCASATAFVLGRPGLQTEGAALDDVLRRTGRYVASYLEEGFGLVLEESYQQRMMDGTSIAVRRLRSDITLVINARYGWVALRDVFEVDGRAVRDREHRLLGLFTDPRADALAQAHQVVAEGARFNLTPRSVTMTRTINMPFTALRFFQAEIQGRSRFRLEAVTSRGRRLARLHFTEIARPRLIASPDDAAASGYALVQPDSGVIEETSLTIQTGGMKGTVTTQFGPEPSFVSWRPVSMHEVYGMAAARTAPSLGGAYVLGGHGVSLEGRAEYTNIRRFEVLTDTALAPGR